MKSARLVVVSAMLMLALVVGVSSASADRNAEQVTLRVLYNNGNIPPMQAMIANFERVYPNIKIEPQFVDGGAVTQALLPQLQAGNAPDVFQVQPGFYTTVSPWALGKAGYLMDLKGAPWQKRVYGPAKQWVWFKDKLFAWPMVLGPHGVAYNKDIFRDLNLRVPTTFRQLVQLCPRIAAAGKIPIANGFAASNITGIVMYQMFSAAFVYSKDKKWDANRIAKKTTFASSPLWQRALNAILELKNAGCFGPAPQGVTIPAATQQFARGQAAMSILAFAQMPGVLSITPNMNYGFFTLPADRAQDTTMSAAISQAVAIYAKTRHPREAKLFVDFLARPKQNSLWAKMGGGVAGFDATKGVFPSFAEGYAKLAREKKMVISTHKYLNPTMTTGPSGISSQIVGLFTGQATVDSALRAQDYLWDHPTATTAP